MFSRTTSYDFFCVKICSHDFWPQLGDWGATNHPIPNLGVWGYWRHTAWGLGDPGRPPGIGIQYSNMGAGCACESYYVSPHFFRVNIGFVSTMKYSQPKLRDRAYKRSHSRTLTNCGARAGRFLLIALVKTRCAVDVDTFFVGRYEYCHH